MFISYSYRFTTSFVYFGLSLNTGTLSGNIYVNTALSGLLEIPAKLITIVLIESKTLGRRLTLFGAMLICALANFCSIPLLLKGENMLISLNRTRYNTLTICNNEMISTISTSRRCYRRVVTIVASLPSSRRYHRRVVTIVVTMIQQSYDLQQRDDSNNINVASSLSSRRYHRRVVTIVASLPSSRRYHLRVVTIVALLPSSRRYHRRVVTIIASLPSSRRYHRIVYSRHHLFVIIPGHKIYSGKGFVPLTPTYSPLGTIGIFQNNYLINIFLSIVCFTTGYGTAVTVISLIGKMCATGLFAAIYVYTAEIYPTEIRHIGVATASMFARFGSMIAPFMGEPMVGTFFIYTRFTDPALKQIIALSFYCRTSLKF